MNYGKIIITMLSAMLISSSGVAFAKNAENWTTTVKLQDKIELDKFIGESSNAYYMQSEDSKLIEVLKQQDIKYKSIMDISDLKIIPNGIFGNEEIDKHTIYKDELESGLLELRDKKIIDLTLEKKRDEQLYEHIDYMSEFIFQNDSKLHFIKFGKDSLEKNRIKFYKFDMGKSKMISLDDDYNLLDIESSIFLGDKLCISGVFEKEGDGSQKKMIKVIDSNYNVTDLDDVLDFKFDSKSKTSLRSIGKLDEKLVIEAYNGRDFSFYNVTPDFKLEKRAETGKNEDIAILTAENEILALDKSEDVLKNLTLGHLKTIEDEKDVQKNVEIKRILDVSEDTIFLESFDGYLVKLDKNTPSKYEKTIKLDSRHYADDEVIDMNSKSNMLVEKRELQKDDYSIDENGILTLYGKYKFDLSSHYKFHLSSYRKDEEYIIRAYIYGIDEKSSVVSLTVNDSDLNSNIEAYYISEDNGYMAVEVNEDNYLNVDKVISFDTGTLVYGYTAGHIIGPKFPKTQIWFIDKSGVKKGIEEIFNMNNEENEYLESRIIKISQEKVFIEVFKSKIGDKGIEEEHIGVYEIGAEGKFNKRNEDTSDIASKGDEDIDRYESPDKLYISDDDKVYGLVDGGVKNFTDSKIYKVVENEIKTQK
jgi:hypothetical protein